MEDIAYRRLLDAYYLAEGPLPVDDVRCARLARMRDHVDIVRAVLAEFFVLTDDGWRHARCDAEIMRKQEKSDKARTSARKRWPSDPDPVAPEPDTDRNANAMRTHTEGNAPNSQEPITNNQDNDNNRAGEAPGGPLSPSSSSSSAPAPPPPSPPDAPAGHRDPIDARVLVTPPSRAADRFDPGGVTEAGVIAAWLREQEKSAGRQATAITSMHPAVLQWAEEAVPHPEIAEAYRVAVEQRQRSGDTSPINPGYVDAVLRRTRQKASRPSEAAPIKPRPPEWQRDTATMRAKADEIGLRINGDWTADELQWQITQRLRAAKEAA
jgi:uncharacterized protein YdaU (DUF1376 family)